MGHSEPSSGIAGVMKAVLAIEHGVIPPTVGLKTLNPNSKHISVLDSWFQRRIQSLYSRSLS